jgi:hypothetical protein
MRLLFGALIFIGISFLVLSLFSLSQPVYASVSFQQPTGEIATVTSTPQGPMVTAREDGEAFVNLRSGPGLFYDKIGVLLAGQQVPAKGRSSGGDWILVEYPGVPGGVAWVYAPFVNLSPGELPMVEPPPTPTPLVTSTIDPTLAAQFVVTSEPTRLPTFTIPPPLVIPTYTVEARYGILSKIPLGLIIISFAAIGILLGLFALSQGR